MLFSLSLPHYSLLHVVKKAYRFRGHSLITIQILDTVDTTRGVLRTDLSISQISFRDTYDRFDTQGYARWCRSSKGTVVVTVVGDRCNRCKRE